MAWSVNDFRSSNFISSYASNDAKLPIHFKMVVNWVYTQCMSLLEEHHLPLDLGLGIIRWCFYLITPQSCLGHPKVWIARWPNSLVVETVYLHMATACPMRLFLYPSPPELLSKLMTVPHIACGLIDGWLFSLVPMKGDLIQIRWLESFLLVLRQSTFRSKDSQSIDKFLALVIINARKKIPNRHLPPLCTQIVGWRIFL